MEGIEYCHRTLPRGRKNTGEQDIVTTSVLLRELQAILLALEEDGVSYALCGGMAMAVHGLERATKDIDLLIRFDDLERTKTIAKRNGFVFESLPMTFQQGKFQLFRLLKGIEFAQGRGQDLLMLDLMMVTPYLQDVWDSRIRVQTLFGPLWVVSRDGMIWMKKAAGRPQDLQDVAFLEGEYTDES